MKKQTKISDIANYLLNLYPKSSQEEWDNSGFFRKYNQNHIVKTICICLDVNEEIINKCIKNNVNLIISHHPIFINDTFLTPNLKKIIKKIKHNKLNILSLHTCFDNSKNGMNFLIAKKIKLQNINLIENYKFVIGNFKKKLSTKQIAEKFRKNFNLNIIMTNSKNDKKFKKLAICAGSGYSIIEQAFAKLIKKNILIITGDVKYHNWLNLNSNNLFCIDVGHSIENCFVDFIACDIHKKFQNIKIFCYKTKNQSSII